MFYLLIARLLNLNNLPTKNWSASKNPNHKCLLWISNKRAPLIFLGRILRRKTRITVLKKEKTAKCQKKIERLLKIKMMKMLANFTNWTKWLKRNLKILSSQLKVYILKRIQNLISPIGSSPSLILIKKVEKLLKDV